MAFQSDNTASTVDGLGTDIQCLICSMEFFADNRLLNGVTVVHMTHT